MSYLNSDYETVVPVKSEIRPRPKDVILQLIAFNLFYELPIFDGIHKSEKVIALNAVSELSQEVATA